jgi:hypothetical protein
MKRRFLSLKQIAEVKKSEAVCNAIQKREGTKHQYKRLTKAV